MIDTRNKFGTKYCVGNGVEIGAGVCPTEVHQSSTVVYVDKQSPEGLRQYFGVDQVVEAQSIQSIANQEFDFVIANHVLEHCSNVIKELLKWIKLLRSGGTLFITLPNRHLTNDNMRLLTPPTHFILDYLYGASDSDFESREHIGSFLWSWNDVGGLQGMTKTDAATAVQAAMHADENDLHWHVFNHQTMMFVVNLAAVLSGKEVDVLESINGFKASSEHALVVRLTNSEKGAEIRANFFTLKNTLRSTVYDTAMELLDGSITHGLTKDHAGKLFEVSEGKMRWVQHPNELVVMGLDHDDYTYVEVTDSEARLLVKPPCSRTEAISSRLEVYRNKKGIELSPGAAPLLMKEVFDVLYADRFDHFSNDDRHYFDAAPIEIDVVLGESLIHEVMEKGIYYYFVSSHVIEHIPDFIQHFISIRDVLVDGGKIVMYVPDKRYTFDTLRPVTTVEDIECAHAEKLRIPSREMAIDCYHLSDFDVTAEGLWTGTCTAKPCLSLEEAQNLVDQKGLENIDCHCHTFTPESIRLLLDHVIAHYVNELRVVEITETPHFMNEFIIELELGKN
ncbi:methyltransferase domain-containing protein [Pseudodesulfovibrio sp. JC047]|uniref:class I SAM-dependent methyltransferase n=1 Tax=Pseudodesulfovibrio sp. JC047 TaxID=2683199 RepID=UPI0013D47856|nr:methyltransferase domain-containing protein [Pseudodesulfovibrio sp. JC047]NDV19826.1 methyltransferase domain-containing protein [Pseudodesulfovibrio sp. JC047]